MIFNVIRKHLQTHAINLLQPAIQTNIFQHVENVKQTQFVRVPDILENLILQDFNVSELKRLPIIILLKIHNSSVIILPKYINTMDSRDSTLKNPDNSHSDPCSNPGIEDLNNMNFKVLQYPETPPKASEKRALSPDGKQDPLEAPNTSKKRKVTGVMEYATKPKETEDGQKITDTVSEIDTYTSLDNGVKQDNIFPNAIQHNVDHNKDKFYVENEVSGIEMRLEEDLTAAPNTSDSDTTNKVDPSQTEAADIDMKAPDADSDNQPSPDASSSTAEANNMSAISSENRLQEIVEIETHDTKQMIDEQPEEDNHPSPAKRQGRHCRRSRRSENRQIKGYRGLKNQGATCYLNAVLQTLFMTKDFREVIMDLNEESKKSLSFELQKLFKDLDYKTKSNTGSATTREVTKTLNIENVCEQQDAAEFYQKILSMIEPEAAKIFQGQKKHSTSCKDGNHDPIEEFVSFFSLAIAMDSDQHKINVKESFDAQFEVMHMDGEDQLFCETCKRMTDMEMSCTISELPDVLTLHLQRFYMDYCYMTYMKNHCPVEIPLQLEVQDHHIYDLYALVNHTGSLSGGHYYTDIKSFDDQQWYEFNDSTVQRISKTYDVRHIISNMACLLFFKKSAKQNVHVTSQEVKTVMRSDHSNCPQNNTTSNSKDSVIQPHGCTDLISNVFTVSLKEDQTAAPNTSDSDTTNKVDPSQTEAADIDMKARDADSDNQLSPDASSSTAEADNMSAISSENFLQEIVVIETHDTKQMIDEQPEEDNHPSQAKRQDLGITMSTFSEVRDTERPEQCMLKDGHKSLNGEYNLPTDSDSETEANPEKQIMNPGPIEIAHNVSDLDEEREQSDCLLPGRTVSGRLSFKICLKISIVLCIILVFVLLFTL